MILPIQFEKSIDFAAMKELPNLPAIYVILKDDDILYVGSSFYLRNRICTHGRMFDFMSNGANKLAWCEHADVNTLRKYEREMIIQLKPTLNKNGFNEVVGYPHAKPPIPRSALLTRTLELLKNRPSFLTLNMIQIETTLPEGWLVSIMCNPKMSPSVDRIVLLYEYLSGNKLVLK
jgi:hypothetical protein